MRRGILLTLLILLLGILFVQAQISTDPDSGKEDVDAINDAINKIPLDPDTGEINDSFYKPFVSKAELRIEKVNLWLEENVWWLKYLLHMKPQISWAFLFNLMVILYFLLIIVIKAETLFFFTPKHAKILGAAFFIILLVTGLYAGIAKIMESWLLYLWHVFLPSGILAGILAVIIFLIVAIILALFGINLIDIAFKALKQYHDAKQKFQEAQKNEGNTMAINTLMSKLGK